MRKPSLFALHLTLILTILTLSRGSDSTCNESSAGSCYNNNDALDCQSQVLLYEGFPLTGRTSTLAQDIARFPKVARFTKEFDEFEIPQNHLHISANGNHEGWFVHVPHNDCIHVAMKLVAREIVAEMVYKSETAKRVDLRGPHRLVDENGILVSSNTSQQRLHLLLPRQVFVHESVRPGFVRTLGDGVMTLTTLSMSPRVFKVDPILDKYLCDDLIRDGSTSFHRSSETHYSPGFENYRTSLSGFTPYTHAAKQLHENVESVTQVPPGAAERPQLLKYETGTSWYKAHMDYFHNFENRPLEEVRLFVWTRAQELLKHNVTELSNVLSADKVNAFDHPLGTLNPDIALRLVQDLNLNDVRFNERLLLHYHMMQSDDPIAKFQKVTTLFATMLLNDDSARAEKYFNVWDMPFDNIQDYVPNCIKHVQFNRHATILPILREAKVGGNTAFPQSSARDLEPLQWDEFNECRQGLIVKPSAGQALLFYNRLPTGEVDPTSEHAGCPPKEGEKFAANCFTWDSNQKWAMRFLTPVEELYRGNAMQTDDFYDDDDDELFEDDDEDIETD